MKSLMGTHEMSNGPTKVMAHAVNIFCRLRLYAAQYQRPQNTSTMQIVSMSRMHMSMPMKMIQHGWKMEACMPQSMRVVYSTWDSSPAATAFVNVEEAHAA